MIVSQSEFVPEPDDDVFTVRWYQSALHKAMLSQEKTGIRRFIEIAHRRWGKDEIVLNATGQLMEQRVGTYWHCLPEYGQGRKAIWNAVNAQTGRKRIDEAFPEYLRSRTSNQEMMIELKNGSTWQVIGSDKYDATVGAGPVGITYSEWALANPAAWGYHRPMLLENDGWAAFITTPRGNNHCKAMYDRAVASPLWFAELSNIRHTEALTQEQLDESLSEYQDIYGIDLGRAIFEQEYYCSFAGAMVGAYFGAEMSRAERDKRITSVPVNEDYPVHCVMDLGKSSNNPVWLFQVVGGQLRVVNFYAPKSNDLDDWCSDLRDLGFNGKTYVPHDIMVTEWGTKRTRMDRLRDKKMNPVRVARVSVADGLQAGRMAINNMVIDREACEQGIEGLKSYRREWDAKRKAFNEAPVKDWAEHIGSAWRYLGLCWRDAPEVKPKGDKKQELEYVVTSTGQVMSNMSVKEAVEAMAKRKRRNGNG